MTDKQIQAASEQLLSSIKEKLQAIASERNPTIQGVNSYDMDRRRAEFMACADFFLPKLEIALRALELYANAFMYQCKEEPSVIDNDSGEIARYAINRIMEGMK